MRITRKFLLSTFIVATASILIGGGAMAISLPLGNPSDGAPDEGQPAAKRPVLTKNSIPFGVYDPQAYDKSNFGRERTFEQALEPGYRLVSGFGKPVIVAELGYEGDESYVSSWAKSVAAPHPEFPRLAAIVYYNDKEVFAWPQNFGRPNWRIGTARLTD